ncbi:MULTISPECIES: hypothetical protein [Niastella]|uniref:Lipoprotein n=1 Tax=Niastella soli TaxID=2821487 RepID=A0ABS3Z336_9BACT|nr:hypothetical protein [Niastella soli]MBO9204549.1 hypothetical protein [Niastella soli]
MNKPSLKLITAILIISFFSCKPKATKGTTLGAFIILRDQAAASTQKTDTTLLNFRFGMNRDEVKRKFKELEADSTIYFDDLEKCYCYVLNTGKTGNESKINCRIVPFFYKEELFTVSFASYQQGGKAIDGETDFLAMNSYIENKYGICHVSFWPASESLSPFNVWFFNNEIFMVYQNEEGAVLQFTDAVREIERSKL